MSKETTINPPRPIHATPPASAEAKAIAKGDVAFKQFQDDLQAQIDENTPSWRNVFKDIFGGE